jgi:hypothetical protein
MGVDHVGPSRVARSPSSTASTPAARSAAAARWICARGHAGALLMGFCAGAMASIIADPAEGLIAIVAINPALFVSGPSWRTQDGLRGPLL